MLLRFNEVPRDVARIDETGFLDRKDSPRVRELIGRVVTVDAAFKKTGTKAVQTAISGQPRAIFGSITFAGGEDDDEMFLRRLAARWEADFLPGYARYEHYEIAWHHLSWGKAHELRFFLPLWNKAEQAPLQLTRSLFDRADLWTRVQALTFGLGDPFPRYRSGMRPDFQVAERGPIRGLRSALVAYIEDAVMAGEISSRREVIADLGKIGFEIAQEDPDALTVRYTGSDEDLARKAKRPVVLTGPAFSEGFGQIDDPRIMELEQATRAGVARLRAEAEAHSQELAPSVEQVLEAAAQRQVAAVLDKVDHGLGARLQSLQERADALASEKEAGLADKGKTVQELAEKTRREINNQLADFQKVARESKDALVQEATRDLTASAEATKVFQRKLDAAQRRVDELTGKKDDTIKKLTYGLVAAGVIAVMSLVPTVYFAVGAARLVAEVKVASAEIGAQRETLAALTQQTTEEVDQHRAALTHAVTLQGQVQEALQGMAQSLAVLGDAVRIEQKADGTNALTIYTRKIPTVRNCDRQPGCVTRIDTRSY